MITMEEFFALKAGDGIADSQGLLWTCVDKLPRDREQSDVPGPYEVGLASPYSGETEWLGWSTEENGILDERGCRNFFINAARAEIVLK